MHRACAVILALGVLWPLVGRAGDDPEPPGKGGVELRKLRGKWEAVSMKMKGRELKAPAGTTYHFEGDKVTVKTSRLTYVAKVKYDAKKKPPIIELTREDTKATIEYAVKLDKGELLLAPMRVFGKAKDKGTKVENVDFTGENNPVMTLVREKKEK
jgi:uncharacterized protein (TIGR03067 family)